MNEIGVGMLGYAFMGKAHSNGFRKIAYMAWPPPLLPRLVAIAGRDDWGHIAILDHPDNTGFPIAWRVDAQLGVGPSRQILQDWRLTEGESEVTRYRLVVYTGRLDPTVLHRAWTAYASESR